MSAFYTFLSSLYNCLFTSLIILLGEVHTSPHRPCPQQQITPSVEGSNVCNVI